MSITTQEQLNRSSLSENSYLASFEKWKTSFEELENRYEQIETEKQNLRLTCQKEQVEIQTMKNELEVMRKKAEQLLNSKRKEPKSIEGKDKFTDAIENHEKKQNLSLSFDEILSHTSDIEELELSIQDYEEKLQSQVQREEKEPSCIIQKSPTKQDIQTIAIKLENEINEKIKELALFQDILGNE